MPPFPFFLLELGQCPTSLASHHFAPRILRRPIMEVWHFSKIKPLACDMNSTRVHLVRVHPPALCIFHCRSRYQLQDDIRHPFNRDERVTRKMSHQVRVLGEEWGFDYARADGIHAHAFSEELLSNAASKADDCVCILSVCSI